MEYHTLFLFALGFVQMVLNQQLEHFVACGDMGLLTLEIDVEVHDGGAEEKFHLNLG